ncbi:nicotinamide mononucleotide-binding domain [Hymenobacter roseosalivarius DSM 11622]|uniref:Nicotinamide mononucleotide-binding domain n=1 Tax=Hymenobacter roseosalivarius DSM 11622 TaxID=645990 RepID=A0A1W1VTS1_9BACT|nr:ATP-binding protein [Hymenobacter roseosalivarius]SMB96630.1 nicotinamide mononucleotide-binding domain [Hymenobacter roseosalivarius DSM 11622]
MLRVAITGPESTGKSTLSRLLAEYYKTTWAPEYARQYLEEYGPGYTLQDLEAIAHGQLAAEAAAAATAHEVVFFDTDLLVIKIWAEDAFGQCPAWILRQLEQQRYDLVLLPNIDLPWEFDPLREHPHRRQYFYDLYLNELRNMGATYVEINGPPAQRFEQARKAVDAL